MCQQIVCLVNMAEQTADKVAVELFYNEEQAEAWHTRYKHLVNRIHKLEDKLHTLTDA